MRIERDQRGAPRVELRMPALLTTESGQRIEAELRNLSLSGAFFACDEKAGVRSRLCLELEEPEGGEPLCAELEVVRVSDEGIGCRFLAFDTRTSTRLRTLISHCVRRAL